MKYLNRLLYFVLFVFYTIIFSWTSILGQVHPVYKPNSRIIGQMEKVDHLKNDLQNEFELKVYHEDINNFIDLDFV